MLLQCGTSSLVRRALHFLVGTSDANGCLALCIITNRSFVPIQRAVTVQLRKQTRPRWCALGLYIRTINKRFCMSDNTYSEVLPSDHCWFLPVRHLLKTITLGAWLRAKPPSSVITLQASTTCGQALRTLAAAEISSAPVFDGNVYVGFLDVDDILKALLGIVNVRELTDENREYKLRNAGNSSWQGWC